MILYSFRPSGCASIVMLQNRYVVVSRKIICGTSPQQRARGRYTLDILARLSSERPEDKRAQAHIKRNWGTIEKLADTLSGGKYSADKAKQAAPPPQAQGLIIIDQARPRVADVPVPYLRISVNGRVVLADSSSSIQLHFLGQIKRVNGEQRFVIATAENGFVAPLDSAICEKIADLADLTINRSYSEDDLAEAIKTRLQIA
jgi:hypothetical protein